MDSIIAHHCRETENMSGNTLFGHIEQKHLDAERQTNQTPMPLLTSHRLGIHNFRPKTPTRPSCPG